MGAFVGSGALAGCAGLSSSTSSEQTPAETTDSITETPAPETVNPANTAYQQTPTPTPEPTPTPTPTETPAPDLSGREHYFNWIHGDDEQILDAVQGDGQDAASISFTAIDDALEAGFEDADRVQAIANGLQAASQEYKVDDEGYENRHRHILSALHQTLEQKDGDQWNFEVIGMQDFSKSPAFGDNIDYSKVWVEEEDGEYTNINAGLGEVYRHQTHIKGKRVEGEDIEDRIQRELQFIRDPDDVTTRSGHDYEAMENAIEYLRNKGEEVTDDDIEEADGVWFKKLSRNIMGDGIPVPSSVADWKQYHEGLETGPDVFLGLNEAYHNEGYDGDMAQFTVNSAVTGSVSVDDLPDDYTLDDGVPGNPER
ncbi:hypothetical protein C443_00037 [Haloarcula argentinensis DSM 12282]|nr:hypothetical protein C443_00037 [Haloarcula argentinensis DSM 12282]